MIELIKKAVVTGMGAASLTKEKIDEFSKDLINVGKLSEQEGEKLVEEMRKKSEESKEALKQQIDGMVKTTLRQMEVARFTDIEGLRTEIEGLRKEVEELRAELKSPLSAPSPES